MSCGNHRRLFALLTSSPELLDHIEGDESLLSLAEYWRHYDVIEWMLEHGADPDLVEEGGNTLLIGAAIDNDVQRAQILLDHGASLEKANSDYETPLGYACAYDAVDVVKLLCERGADVNGTEGRGYSYLHGVRCAKQLEIESILISHGARVIEEEPKLVWDGVRNVPREPKGSGDGPA